jgi:signal transduction histidine kinase
MNKFCSCVRFRWGLRSSKTALANNGARKGPTFLLRSSRLREVLMIVEVKKRVAPPLLGVLLCLLAGPFGAAQTNPKNVLVLLSFFEPNHVSTNIMESTLRRRVPWPVNFTVSYLENPHLEEKSYRDSLAETFRLGYVGKKLDLVIVASEPAFRFAVEYRDKMFPGVPIVFWAISTVLADQRVPGVTGVATPSGARGTIDLALRLHPDTTNIAVITNTSETEKVWLADVHNELLGHQDKVKEIDIIGSPSGQMLERIDSLPPHTVALFQMFPQDTSQPVIGTWDVLSATAEHMPTYSVFQTLGLDHGGIGGVYYDPSKESVLAGELAARVLSGERPDNIPVAHITELQARVDWRQLQKWHIPESALPPGSAVLFKPPTAWDQYKGYVIGGLSLISLEGALIVALIWQRARRRRAEEALLNLGGRLIQAQEEERHRIARELHDDFQQRLAMLAIDLETLAQSVDRDRTEARPRLYELLNSVSELGTDLHSLSHQLHSSTLESLGLVAALRALSEEFADHHEIDVSFVEQNVPRKIPPEAALCLFRIAQEALQNVRKHSRASAAEVRLEGLGDIVHLSISDSGMGFDADNGARQNGIGIRSMEERLRLVKGTFAIHSRPLGGTRIEAWVPVEVAEPSKV